MRVEEGDIVLKYRIDTPALNVWNALTIHEEMIQWYFDNIPAFIPEPGFECEFVVKNEDRIFTHHWTVKELVPHKRISYEWIYTEWQGRSVSHFDIEALDDGSTIVHVRIEILEDFDDDVPEFKRESCIGGWDYFVGGNLKRYLGKGYV